MILITTFCSFFPVQLRYADRWDWLMLVVGIFTNVAAGALNPASSLIFRGITDVLMNGQHQMDNGTLDMEQFSEGSGWLRTGLGRHKWIANVVKCNENAVHR